MLQGQGTYLPKRSNAKENIPTNLLENAKGLYYKSTTLFVDPISGLEQKIKNHTQFLTQRYIIKLHTYLIAEPMYLLVEHQAVSI
jgi:hypothetical protein